MTHTENTLSLDSDWDLAFDDNGYLAFLSGADAICQNVCNECRLFLHDAYFRYEEGIDWFSDQLGKPLQVAVVTDRIRKAAMSVKGVISVVNVELTEVDKLNRVLHGVITIETEYGYVTGRI